MDTTTLALGILTAGNIPIPDEVAARLLAAVPEEQLPNSLLNMSGFAGATASTVARSSKRRAKLVAANTDDQQILRDLFTALGVQVAALNAMADANSAHDPDLLIDIHRVVCEDRYLAADYEKARRWVTRVVPLEYQLEYLASPSRRSGYEMNVVARRIGSALAAGDTMPIAYIEPVLVQMPNERDERSRTGFLDAIGERLGAECPTDALATRLRQIEEQLTPEHADRIIAAAAEHAKLVDREVLAMHLVRIESPAAFAQYQRQCIDSDYRGPTPQAPRALVQRTHRFTPDAFELLAASFPGAVAPVVERLVAEDPGCARFVETALGTNRCDVAHALLARNAEFTGSANRTVLDADQFHRAIAMYVDGEHIEQGSRPRPLIDGHGAARAVPQDAATEDLLALLGVVATPAAMLQRLTVKRDATVSYTISSSVFAAAVASLDDGSRLAVVDSVLYVWNHHSVARAIAARKSSEAPAVEELAVDIDDLAKAAVDTIPASLLCERHDGERYVAHRLIDELGDDPDRWLTAIGLIPTALVSLSKVIAATKRL